MFDSVRLDHRLDKATFKSLEPRLRDDLLEAQFDLVEQKRNSVLVLVNGPDGAGKGAVTELLFNWLDARQLKMMSYEASTDEERRRPPAWRYWRDMPAYGEIGVVLGSWYHQALLGRATGAVGAAAFAQWLARINRFEAMLRAEGVRLLKLWLHIEPAEARRRLAAARDGDRFDRPVVLEWAEIDRRKERRRLVEAGEEMARITSTAVAPWSFVPATDAEYLSAAVAMQLLDTLRSVTADAAQPAPRPAERAAPEIGAAGLPRPGILSSLDLSLRLEEADYDAELAREQRRLTRLTTEKAFRKLGVVCAFEGNDAAGKGGAIQRLRQALDPRSFRVHPVSAPTDEERARPYLWRFWRNLPGRGHVGIFDRSWYGRVLVERVEGFCSEADWLRAYEEINDFEAGLIEARYVVVKLWLATSREEQLRRFKAREATPFKHFKITPDDWRNREKWPLYERAITDMVDRTSTPDAPWTLVEAEDKRFARVKVVRTVADRIEAALDQLR